MYRRHPAEHPGRMGQARNGGNTRWKYQEFEPSTSVRHARRFRLRQSHGGANRSERYERLRGVALDLARPAVVLTSSGRWCSGPPKPGEGHCRHRSAPPRVRWQGCLGRIPAVPRVRVRPRHRCPYQRHRELSAALMSGADVRDWRGRGAWPGAFAAPGGHAVGDRVRVADVAVDGCDVRVRGRDRLADL